MSSSDDENDSRTASVGLQRPRPNGSSTASRQSSRDGRIGKKQARNKAKVGKRDVHDFVPQGGRFSTAPLDVEADATSSSGSSSSGSEDDSASEKEGPSETQKPLGSVPAAINWNKGSRSTIRTSLAGKASLSGGNTPSSAFESVNEKYWRSGSASLSEEESQGRTQAQEDLSEDEQRNGNRVRAGQQPYYVDESEGSESGEVSEGGDSIMLNLGPGNDRAGHSMPPAGSDPFQIDTQPDAGLVSTNGHMEPRRSKEDAFCVFSKKYKTPPAILADLDRKDLETQARCFFYNRNIHDIDLQHHISCTECLQEGHLAIVCPTKECEHCGAWDVHESSFCPSWRRCQKCRERGHDENTCSSALKGSAAEFPCDYCGADTHLETECDLMWKFPRYPPYPGPIVVSLSCSYCTSNHHLMGDCPSLVGPTRSSSWTLKGYDPAMITNLNSIRGRQPLGGRTAMNGSKRGDGMKIRGRAGPGARSPSPESDLDMFEHPGRREPINNRNSGRPNIRIGSGIGKNRNLAGPPPQQNPGSRPGSRQSYRDRQDDYHHQRQRSLSPRPRPPPPGRGRGRGGGGGGGAGRRGGRFSQRREAQRTDAYRPMPSAGRKAWDTFRL